MEIPCYIFDTNISKLKYFLSVKQLKQILVQLNLSLHLIRNFGVG